MALRFDPSPIYLGVKLDRSMTFGLHIKVLAEKTSKRVNIIKKLVGSNWPASFTTLRTFARALVYVTAEHAAPVWSHSRHTIKMNTVLNDALRIISGAIAPTPIAMLPVLAGIPPADVRRDHIVLKHAEKADQPGILLPSITNNTPPQRIHHDHFATSAEKLQNCATLSPSWVQDRGTE